ncbi:MAG: tetratricopeptide repeat protein [Elusimicrobiales bacterium]
MDTRDRIKYYTHLIEELSKKGSNDDLFWLYLERGLYYMQEHEYELALSDFTHASFIKPDESIVYYNLAIVYRMMKDEDMAFKCLKKVIDINDRDPFAYYELGKLLYDKKEYSLAEEYYTKAIKNGKRGSDIYYRRALTRYRMGMINGAIGDINLAIKMKPSAADYYVLRANINLLTKNYVGVINDFNRLVEIKPSHSIYRLNRAIIYATIASLLKLIAKNSIPSILVDKVKRSLLGFEQDYHRYYDMAEEDINVAVESEGLVFGDFYISPSYYIARGAIYLSYGKHIAAAMDFSVAKSILKSYFQSKTNLSYKSMRALVEMYLDNYDEARKYISDDDTTSKINILRACWWWKAERNFERTYFWFKKAYDNGFDIFEVIDDIFEGYFLQSFLKELENRKLLSDFLR